MPVRRGSIACGWRAQSTPFPYRFRRESELWNLKMPPWRLGGGPSERFRGADYILKHRVTIDLLPQRQVFVACPLFSLDAIIDVRSGGIPANHPSLVVKQRVVMEEKPPVLSIFAQDSFFVLKWHTPRKRFQALISYSCDILLIKGSMATIRRHGLFNCEARVIEHGLIHIKNGAIRIHHDDHLRYGINNMSKLSF